MCLSLGSSVVTCSSFHPEYPPENSIRPEQSVEEAYVGAVDKERSAFRMWVAAGAPPQQLTVAVSPLATASGVYRLRSFAWFAWPPGHPDHPKVVTVEQSEDGCNFSPPQELCAVGGRSFELFPLEGVRPVRYLRVTVTATWGGKRSGVRVNRWFAFEEPAARVVPHIDALVAESVAPEAERDFHRTLRGSFQPNLVPFSQQSRGRTRQGYAMGRTRVLREDAVPATREQGSDAKRADAATVEMGRPRHGGDLATPARNLDGSFARESSPRLTPSTREVGTDASGSAGSDRRGPAPEAKQRPQAEQQEVKQRPPRDSDRTGTWHKQNQKPRGGGAQWHAELTARALERLKMRLREEAQKQAVHVMTQSKWLNERIAERIKRLQTHIQDTESRIRRTMRESSEFEQSALHGFESEQAAAGPGAQREIRTSSQRIPRANQRPTARPETQTARRQPRMAQGRLSEQNTVRRKTQPSKIPKVRPTQPRKDSTQANASRATRSTVRAPGPRRSGPRRSGPRRSGPAERPVKSSPARRARARGSRTTVGGSGPGQRVRRPAGRPDAKSNAFTSRAAAASETDRPPSHELSDLTQRLSELEMRLETLCQRVRSKEQQTIPLQPAERETQRQTQRQTQRRTQRQTQQVPSAKPVAGAARNGKGPTPSGTAPTPRPAQRSTAAATPIQPLSHQQRLQSMLAKLESTKKARSEVLSQLHFVSTPRRDTAVATDPTNTEGGAKVGQNQGKRSGEGVRDRVEGQPYRRFYVRAKIDNLAQLLHRLRK